MTEKRPRQWAADIVDAWITRQPHEPIIEQIPGQFRQMITEQARNSCSLIQYWSKRARVDGMDAVPKTLRPVVVKYWAHRGK